MNNYSDMDIQNPVSSDGDNRKGMPQQRNIIPVTIRMALDVKFQGSSDDSMLLRDGRILNFVKLVCAIRSVEENSTKVKFQVEDGTGLIEVVLWHDPMDCEAMTEIRMSASVENTYVRVIGQLKTFEGRISLVGHRVERVSTCNELTHHMLEVMYCAEKYKKSTTFNGYGSEIPRGINNYSNGTFGNSVMQQPQSVLTASSGASNGITDIVIQYIRSEGEKNDAGADMNVCIQHLSNQYSEHEVRQVFEQLSCNGQVYSTIDETHFKYIF